MKSILAVLLCFYLPVIAAKSIRASKEQIQGAFLEPAAVQDLYQMLKDTTEILDRAGIKYAVVSGTALGVVRHQGLIPWDDDVDIAIFHEDEPKLINLKPAFDALGYYVMYDTNKAVMYNVSKKGNPALDDRAELTFPFVDIFVVHNDPKTKRVIYSNWRTREYFPEEWYPEDVFYPIKKCKFGSVTVKCINNPEWYVKHYYGDSWKTKGYIAPRHYKPNHTVPYEFEFSEHPEFLNPSLPAEPLLDRVNTLDRAYFN
jgi:lipopolysaccharide cholinephosphotransferase